MDWSINDRVFKPDEMVNGHVVSVFTSRRGKRFVVFEAENASGHIQICAPGEIVRFAGVANNQPPQAGLHDVYNSVNPFTPKDSPQVADTKRSRGERVEFSGVALRAVRNALGVSMETLAEKSGVSLCGITGIESGTTKKPYKTTVDKLQAALRDLGAKRC